MRKPLFEILKMALQNVSRRALRNALTITGLVIFVLIFILVSSLTLTLQKSVTESLSDLGGEVTIWSRGALLPFFGSIPENYTGAVKQIPYVKRASPQILGVSQIDSKDLRVTIGLNPPDISLFYTYTMIEGEMIKTNETRAVIGHLFAEFLEKQVGDNITINEQTLPIVGIYKTDTWIDNVAIVPFKVAQDIFSLKGRASLILVTVTDPNKIDLVISEIRKELPNVSVFKSQEAPARLAPIMNSVTWVSYSLFTIAGVACFFGITNVVMTGVFERTREIGILKALGAKGIDITKMIIYESATLGIIGGAIGCLASLLILLHGLHIPITSTSAMPVSIFPEIFLYGLLLSTAISVLASLYPVWKAVRVRPHEVLRFG
jgi:putative ABC transport system permease protein